MFRIPVLSRVRLHDYLSLLFAFVLLSLESLLRLIAWCFPAGFIDHFRFKLFPFFPRLFVGYGSETEFLPNSPNGTQQTLPPILANKLTHIRDIVHAYNFELFEYFIDSDGYRLAIHRIPNMKRASASPLKLNNVDLTPEDLSTPTNSNSHSPLHGSVPRVRTPQIQSNKPIVLLWHGLMMTSDVWVLDRYNSLAYMLVEEGYDVWLGNNRGNKYSYKNINLLPSTDQFWNFSIDEYGRDLLFTVDYILELTKQPSLIYIGFSQGTAQLFAALSCYPKLNNKIRLACCLAPTGKPHDLRNSFISSMMTATPQLLYLVLGRKAAIPTVLFWQKLFTPHTWVKLLDWCMHMLFSWTLKEIDPSDKLVLYQFLFSTASIKSVVHWFQIIKSGRFASFDDDPSIVPWTQPTHPPQTYPLKNITTPLALFYGAKDTLSDLPFLLANLPRPVYIHKVAEYEHLDCLWASSANKILFPAVLGVIRLHGHTHPDGSEAETPKNLLLVSDSLVDHILSQGVTPDDVETLVELDALQFLSTVRVQGWDLDRSTADLLHAVLEIPGIRANSSRSLKDVPVLDPIQVPLVVEEKKPPGMTLGNKITRRLGRKFMSTSGQQQIAFDPASVFREQSDSADLVNGKN